MQTEILTDITEALLVDFIDGKLSPEQMAQVERWYDESEENRRSLEQLYYVVKLHDMSEAVKNIDPAASLAAFKQRIAQRKVEQKKSSWSRVFGYVAAAVACMIIVGSFFMFRDRGEMCEIFADGGQQKVIVLPDKSTVELKANSTIAFNSSFTKKREVKLDGEAVFNVVKMDGVPFTVAAKGAEIIVKGTKFHFKAYSDSSNIEAVLIQGAIDFSTYSHKLALKPNQKVVYNKGSRRVNIFEVDAELEVFGQRFFDAEPLGTVINTLEQVYDCRISFTDARMENIKFTGTVDRSNLLDHTLKIVTLTTGTSFRREGDAIIIDR